MSTDTETVLPDDHSSDATGVEEHLIEDEMLVEEISIDGMCGVY